MMQHRRGGGMRTVSLISVASLVFFGGGFLLGRFVGFESGRKSASRSALEQLALGGTGGTTGGSSATKLKPLSWPPEGAADKAGPLCFNTCHKARDGVCDEGRLKAGEQGHLLVVCDLGTDCADCGPWTPSRDDVSWREDGLNGPISRLVSRNVEVRVRRTALHPLDYVFAYTDPAKDVDVSAHMNGQGSVEQENSLVFFKIFTAGCRRKDGSRGLFVDVGANFGWFSIMAASLGCRVLAFEPVPDFHAFFEYNLHVNRLAHLVDVRQMVVSAQSGVTLNMTVPSHGVWGTAGIGGMNIDHNIKGTLEQISVRSMRLEELVDREVLLMKMDVEGWEFSVFDGARPVIKKHGIKNIILEYSPGVPERTYQYKELEATVVMLSHMLSAQYSIAHIQDGGPTIHRAPTVPSLNTDLPKMKEVTFHNVLYELADNAKFKLSRLGCQVDQSPELNSVGRHKALDAMNHDGWWTCNSSPEDLSPRSLRSVMGHNTNLWASLDRASMPLAGPVGLIPLTAPNTQYFPDEGAVWGLGRRLCKDIPPKVQVRHRCRCRDPSVCGKEEAEVLRLSAQGDKVIASNFVLPSPT